MTIKPSNRKCELPVAVPMIAELLSTAAKATFFVVSTVVLTVFATVSTYEQLGLAQVESHRRYLVNKLIKRM